MVTMMTDTGTQMRAAAYEESHDPMVATEMGSCNQPDRAGGVYPRQRERLLAMES